MAPPSRPGLTIKAAKKLEEASEAILGVDSQTEASLAASRLNGAYGQLDDVIQLLGTVKDMCDVGMGTYPTYPAVRDVMLEAGNQIYTLKQEVQSTKSDCLMTDMTDREAWRQIGLKLADIASRLRAVQFVPKRKKKEAL